jgi:hypothetical protein
MSRRKLGFIFICIGTAIQLVSLTADYIGIGANPEIIIGWKQQTGLAIGLAIILFGVWLLSKESVT